MNSIRLKLYVRSRVRAFTSALYAFISVSFFIKYPSWWPLSLLSGLVAAGDLRAALTAARLLDTFDQLAGKR